MYRAHFFATSAVGKAMRFMLVGRPVALLTLNGCAGGFIVDGARNASREAVVSVMPTDRPQLDSAATGARVLNATTMGERLNRGTADNHISVSPANRLAIESYATRPEAMACLAALAGAKT